MADGEKETVVVREGGGGGAAGVVIAIVLLIAVVIGLFVFAKPLLEGGSTTKADIDINLPSGSNK